MEKKKPKLSAQFKYWLVALGIVVLTIALYMLLYTYLKSVASWLVIIAYIFIGFPCLLRIRNYLFFAPLYRRFDPDEFLKSGKQWKGNVACQAEAAYFSGDYQTALNLCTAALPQVKSKRQKIFFASRIMKIFFENDDKERFPDAVKQYHETIAGNKKSAKSSPFADFFDKYAAEDYNGALAVNIDLQHARRALEYPMLVLYKNFITALALFKNGEREKALPLFEEVVSTAPKFGFAKISQKYIDAIKSDSADPEFEKLTADPSYEDTVRTTYAKAKKSLRIRRIILLVILAGFIAEMVFITHSTRHPKYPEWIIAASDEAFTESEVIDCFSLYDDGYFYGTIGVCKTNEGLAVGAYGYIGEGEDETIQFDVLGKHMETGKFLTASEVFEGETVIYVFAFSENRADIPKDALHVTKVKTKDYSGYLYFVSATSIAN